MGSIPIMGLSDVDEAMHHLRDAEISMAEFEKQLKWHFTLRGRRASFLDRSEASRLAGRFEGYVNQCATVHGSHAWFRLVAAQHREAPHLDDFMDKCESSRKVNLKWVLKDRKVRLEELREYYAKERAQLIRKQEFQVHLENRQIAESISQRGEE